MNDEQIIELYKAGEKRQAFNLMVRGYSERLYWIIRGIVQTHADTDDALQNTWVSVWNALDTFREDSKLYTWLYRIATNEALSLLKKNRLRAALSFSDFSAQVENTLQADPTFNGDKLQLALQKAIATLPPRQKAVFTMRYFDEMPYEEMAEILGVTESSLKTSYHIAREKVLERIKKNDIED
ncbi:MAG: RNA polymerase sigma factor [Bacteroidales bacterium]|nr:RNA polymerase sigma factor [Bacteroidales bacterium]